MRVGCLLGFSVLPGSPTAVSPKENHTEISICYKADWPIRSGYLLALVAYINPLFLSILAMWLSTFFSGAAHILLLWWSGQECEESTSSSPEFSLHHFHFLSGFPAYTSCLVNQRLFKTWLTDYRQFSHTRQWIRCPAASSPPSDAVGVLAIL